MCVLEEGCFNFAYMGGKWLIVIRMGGMLDRDISVCVNWEVIIEREGVMER
jgi:hypothetical protein